MKRSGVWLAIAAGCVSVAAMAAPRAVVEAVQYPAWLERGGHAVPLKPGTTLQSRDTVRTGGNARVQLKLGEGSTVKLGEQVRFVLEKVEDRGIFRAALKVVSGAFRFTTEALGRKRNRDVSVKVKNVTVGIRGTDLWGKSSEERDLVCLLEGRITVGAKGHPTVALTQPLDFYQKPRDGAPSVAKVDREQVDRWAAETEVAADGAVGRIGGTWRVVVASVADRDAARALRRTLRAMGYPAEIAAADGQFAVQVAGLGGEAAAKSLATNLREVPGVSAPKILEGRP